jgi:hypothetical protein
MLTREEMQALRAPFDLSEHTVREGFKNAAKTKIRWFVYIDRSAIADLLDDMFLGDWGMAEPQIHIQDKKVSAVVGITIRGVTRYDGGEDDSDEGTKGALTNAFRRTAAYGWGMARYLYDMDFDIWTDAYEQGKWDDMRARKNEAFQKFAEWYKKQFGSVGKSTQQQPPPPPAQQSPAPANPFASAAPAQAENGANGEPSPLVKEHWTNLISGVKSHSFNGVKPSGQEIANTINKMNLEGAFSGMKTYQQLLAAVIQRINKHYEKAS